MTLNKVLDYFEDFVANHHILVKFGFGRMADLDPNKIPEYPLMYVEFPSVSYPAGRQVKQYTFEIVFYDLPPDKEDKSRHQREVVSDMMQCAEDLLADIENGFNIFLGNDGWEIVNATCSPLAQQTKQVLCGSMLSLTIALPYVYNACDIPLVGVTPTGAACEVATYENSDGSFTQDINSGSTYIASDITITDIDGSTRSTPANLNVLCAWSNINIRNSDAVTLDTITSYPAGGNNDLADIAIADTGVFSDTTPVPSSIEVSGTISGISANPSTGKLTITVPSVAAGIIYRRSSWGGQSTSYATGDVGYHAAAGTYDYADTGSTVQRLDFAAANPFYTLKENNAFGNKYRFTDSTGAQADDNLAAFDANNFTTNRPTAIPYYVIDHLTGLGWIIAKVGFAQSWATAISTAGSYSDGTNSDYRVPSISEFLDVINCNGQWYLSSTIFERSTVIVSGTEAYMWTGNTDEISSTANAFRWMDLADIRRINKTTTAAMATFAVRNHY